MTHVLGRLVVETHLEVERLSREVGVLVQLEMDAQAALAKHERLAASPGNAGEGEGREGRGLTGNPTRG